MMSPGMSIRHHKARGEWAELRFMLRATELGLRVTKPWGDNSPYGLVIETSGRFLRVQVKMHPLPSRTLLQMPPRLQRPRLHPRSDRLHRRVCDPCGRVVHPPDKSDKRPAGYPANSPELAFEV
jgi:hypothetical protein